MTFESFAQAHEYLLLSTFIITFILGGVVNKTNFCTMGAVSDVVNIGSYDRFRAWLLAIAVALLTTTLLEYLGLVNLDGTFPPYRGGNIIVAEHIIGGIIFGIGMTFASGCGNKTIVRLGAGNLKSLIVIVIISIFAYYMVNPFPNSDQTIFSLLFFDWIRPMSISLTTPSDLGSIISTENAQITRLICGLLIGFGLLYYAFKSAEFRASRNNIIAGIVVGLAVTSLWWISSNANIFIDEETYTMSSYYDEWDMLSDTEEGKPARAATLNTQSLTFINPIGQIYGYFKSAFNSSELTIGLFSVFGVIFGSFVWSLFSKSFRIEWFVDLKDFLNHMVGAIMMGVGAVLALGCTIGQGITGISTLAVGSFLTFFSIVFGSAITMKTQYYRMVYDEASILDALLSSLVDMRLLPNTVRKLEALDD